MKTKFTPGPWKYQKQNGSPTTGPHMISGSKPGYLAEVRDCGSGDVEANARLIAAAPELLNMLKEYVQDYDENYGEDGATDDYVNDMAKRARAAIAKAERLS